MALSEVGIYGKYTASHLGHVRSDPNPHPRLPHTTLVLDPPSLWERIRIKVNSGTQQEMIHINLGNKQHKMAKSGSSLISNG